MHETKLNGKSPPKPNIRDYPGWLILRTEQSVLSVIGSLVHEPRLNGKSSLPWDKAVRIVRHLGSQVHETRLNGKSSLPWDKAVRLVRHLGSNA